MSRIRVIAILIFLIIVMAAVPLIAGCKKMADDTRFVNEAAENILIAMNDGDYASFSKDFDDTLKAELPEASFAEFVSAISGSNGNYKDDSKKLADVNVKEDEGLITASYLADFEVFEDVTFEVTLKDMGNEKKVVGMWFGGPSTNLFIGTTPNKP